MQVEVRPIDKERWHGKKKEEDFGQPLSIEALYDNSTGKYATGLTKEEQERLQIATGYDLSSDFNATKPHPFWNSAAARIKLARRTTVFNTDKPLDLIKVKVLKASRYVANSVKEYEEGLYPEAEFVIFDEAEEVERKASKVQLKNKARKLAMDMSSDMKSNLVQILSEKSVKKQSAAFIDVEIDRIVEEDPKGFIKVAKMDKAEAFIRASILEALYRNILTKEGAGIYYMGDQLASSYPDTVEYFLDPNNSKIKALIFEKLS